MMVTQKTVSYPVLKKFTTDLLLSAGVAESECPILTEIFLWSDLVGRFNYGLRRLPPYLKRFRLGLINSPCHAVFEQKSDSMALLNGKNGFGNYLGHIAMEKAISMAKQTGVGLVGVYESNSYGVGAYYANLAAVEAQIGIALSNSFPKVAPYGGTEPVFGTNPFSFAAPTRQGKAILVDFATSAEAGTTISRAIEQNEKLPDGIAVDRQGNYIHDPAQVAAGALLPFGKAKGFGIGLLVEILAGVITGAGVSHGVASLFKDFKNAGHNGHFFLAIEISRFISLEAYYDRIDSLTGLIKSKKMMPGVDEILLPGEKRWRFFARQMRDGIYVEPGTQMALSKLAQEFNVVTPW